MIIKFEDYINENLKYTDGITLSTSELYLFEPSYLIKENQTKEFVFEKCCEFIKMYILPYFKDLKLGIKNIIPIKFDDTNAANLIYKIVVNKDFVEKIINTIKNDTITFSDNNFEVAIEEYYTGDYIEFGSDVLKYLKNYIKSKKDKTSYSTDNDFERGTEVRRAVIVFLTYRLVLDNKQNIWDELFEQYLKSEQQK